MSGKRIVVWGGALSLVGAGIVLWAFTRWGRDTFTRSAWTVEARGRAFALASAIARCTNRSGGELPPSSGPVPSTPHEVHFTGKEAEAAYAAEAFVCADFHPAGTVHVQIAWTRETAGTGFALGRLDENGDGTVDFEATVRVHCDGVLPERCYAGKVEESRPGDGGTARGAGATLQSTP